MRNTHCLQTKMNPSAQSASADRSSSSNARKEGTRGRENPEQRLVMLHTKRLIFSLAGSSPPSSACTPEPGRTSRTVLLIFFAVTSHLAWLGEGLGRSMSHSPGAGYVNFRTNGAKEKKKSGVRDPFSHRSNRNPLCF